MNINLKLKKLIRNSRRNNRKNASRKTNRRWKERIPRDLTVFFLSPFFVFVASFGKHNCQWRLRMDREHWDDVTTPGGIAFQRNSELELISSNRKTFWQKWSRWRGGWEVSELNNGAASWKAVEKSKIFFKDANPKSGSANRSDREGLCRES